MTADEIRTMKVFGEWNKEVEIEIAAQLAEMNEMLQLLLKTFQFYLEEFQEGRVGVNVKGNIDVTNHY